MSWYIIVVGYAQQSKKTHIVLRGETAESIAAQYGISLDVLKKANPKVKTFYAGTKLSIPHDRSNTEQPILSREKIERKTPDFANSINEDTHESSKNDIKMTVSDEKKTMKRISDKCDEWMEQKMYDNAVEYFIAEIQKYTFTNADVMYHIAQTSAILRSKYNRYSKGTEDVMVTMAETNMAILDGMIITFSLEAAEQGHTKAKEFYNLMVGNSNTRSGSAKPAPSKPIPQSPQQQQIIPQNNGFPIYQPYNIQNNTSNNEYRKKQLQNNIANYEKRIRETQNLMTGKSVVDMGYTRVIQDYKRMIEDAKRELRSMGYLIY